MLDAVDRQRILREAQATHAALASLKLDDPQTEMADPFVIEGAGLMWSSVANGAKGPTRFLKDAFGAAAMKVPLLNQHDTAQVLGVAELTPDSEGLHVRAKVSNTAAARDALTLVRDGGLSGFSIGFNVVTSRKDPDGVRVVTAATLDEVSTVTFPADRAARIQTVGGQPVRRFLHAADPMEREHAIHRADILTVIAEAEAFLATRGIPTPDSTAAEQRSESLSPPSLERETARRALAMYHAAGLSPLAVAQAQGSGSRGAW